MTMNSIAERRELNENLRLESVFLVDGSLIVMPQ